MGEYVTVDETFTTFFSNRSSSSPRYCHVFFLVAFLAEAFIRNIT